MKFLISIFFIFSVLNVSLWADEEVEMVAELIEITQKNLKAQKELLTALLKYKQVRQAFIAEPTSAKLATSLVKSAKIVQKQIETQYLTHLFSKDFLEELCFFNQIGQQQKP